jgi:hypothetical protein
LFSGLSYRIPLLCECLCVSGAIALLRVNQNHCFHGRFVLAADRNSVWLAPALDSPDSVAAVSIHLLPVVFFACTSYVELFCLLGIASPATPGFFAPRSSAISSLACRM